MLGKKPNIILINCDDLGYGDLGCYGSSCNQTPHIDKLAAEGLRMTDFYMASPVCSPSRGAMMTGCYPPRIGFGSFDGKVVLFPGQGCGLSDNEVTIAELLQTEGYRSMIIGKWHCGDQPEFMPTRHGFDDYYGLPYSNDMGRQRGDDDSRPPLPLLSGETVVQEQPDLAGLTERYTEKAVQFIRQNQNAPFFLYFAHMYVHLPHYAPNRFTAHSANGEFGASMACLDWSVGVLMNELCACGLDANTLVIFTSDNGGRATHGGSNAPLRGAKQTTWEGGMRVPCIFRQPGTIPAGTSDALACSLDFLETLSAFAGVRMRPQNEIDSIDLSGWLLAPFETKSPRDTFFYYRQNTLEAVRHKQWKLKVRENGEDVLLLFDLAADVGESRNVYDVQPEVVARLEALLVQCRFSLGDAAQGVVGSDIREIGRAANPKPLAVYDPAHDYIIAMYDKTDRG